MKNIKISERQILFSRANELVRVTPCHKNAIRFEAFPDCRVFDENYTLLPQSAACSFEERDYCVFMTVGRLRLQLEQNGKVTVYRDGDVILEEQPDLAFHSGFRRYERKNGAWAAAVTFCSNSGEHFYGLGHDPCGKFDLKGCAFDLRHVNAKTTVPFVYSSRGYGFLWNNPAVGNVELAENRTRWSVGATRKIDFVVIAGGPKDVCEALADLTGHAPEMPHWATGFWQSRLRYETQEDLLAVARRYRDEHIPLSAIICDYFHWTEQGDYRFDPQYWPDVRSMTDELHAMDTKLIVSVWPTVNPGSKNYNDMNDRNLLIRTTKGDNHVFSFYGPQAEIDVTNPETRAFVFSKLKENYLDQGVDGLWFDEAEPEIHPEHFDNLLLHIGRGDEVGLAYPYYYAQMAYDGFAQMGEVPVTLIRAAYLGSQKFGALVWSGDIPSTFESLSAQVKAGLNMAMCGIPWWNTDIGGFWGADIQSEDFRELIVRWFQFGVFSPVMRLHGSRNRHGEKKRDLKEPTGDPNEIWSFGERNFKILKELVLLRERLRPYIELQMKIAAEKGYPVMRPMFFEYPEDEICYSLGEQYLFGNDILFAPIVEKGQTEKKVYLPEGGWVLTKTKEVFAPGWHTVHAEIGEFVAFVKEGAAVLDCF